MAKQEWKIGDCLELLPTIEDKSIDMILTDLPYGTTACKWDTIINQDALWEEYKRTIKKDGVIVLTASQPFTSILVGSNLGMFRYGWIWEKDNGTNFLSAKRMPLKTHEDVLIFSPNNDIGENKELREYFQNEMFKTGLTTCKQINQLLGTDDSGGGMASHYFSKKDDLKQWALPTLEMYEKMQKTGYFKIPYSQIEEMYVGRVNETTYNPQMKQGSKYVCKSGKCGEIYGGNNKSVTTINDGCRYPTTILKFNRDKTKVHPTQKPVALFEYLIKTYTNEGDTVHDSCLGSGTTLEACMNTGRNCIGFEISDEWVPHYEKRLMSDNSKLTDTWECYTPQR